MVDLINAIRLILIRNTNTYRKWNKPLFPDPLPVCGASQKTPSIPGFLWDPKENGKRNLPVFVFLIKPLTSLSPSRHIPQDRGNPPFFPCSGVLLSAEGPPRAGIYFLLSSPVSTLNPFLHKLRKKPLEMSDRDEFAKGRIFNSSDVIFLNS